MQKIRSHHSHFTALISLGMLAVILLTSCAPAAKTTQSPTNPPPPTTSPQVVKCDPLVVSNNGQQTILTLPDGSQVYLGENTEIELTVAGYCPGLKQHLILLKQGKVAVNSTLPEGKWIVITSPNGYIAQVGKIGLVIYNPDTFIFALDCTTGTCNLGSKEASLSLVNCGESGFLDSYGSFNGPFNIDLDDLAGFGDWLQPTCLPAKTSTPKAAEITPTLTETPTPDVGATATAYCSSFKQQFKLTPCPTLKP